MLWNKDASGIERLGFGLVVSAVGWHAGNPGWILGKGSLYKFRYIPQSFEYAP
jgi:hypothetical protein